MDYGQQQTGRSPKSKKYGMQRGFHGRPNGSRKDGQNEIKKIIPKSLAPTERCILLIDADAVHPIQRGPPEQHDFLRFHTNWEGTG